MEVVISSDFDMNWTLKSYMVNLALKVFYGYLW